MAGSAKVQINLANTERILRELKRLKNLHCDVGINAEEHEDSGIPVSEVAKYLEFGWTQTVTARQSGWFMGQGYYVPQGTLLKLPPRPTFQSTYKANHKKWSAIGVMFLKGFCNAPLNKMTKALEAMATEAQTDLKACIDTNGASNGSPFAPRSPLTMAMYSKTVKAEKHKTDGTGTASGSKALRNTGHFERSIIFDIIND
jgi:hypothetical protein